MGNITWTKSWSSGDDGTVLDGADLQNIQNDITTVVNGNITNSNISGSAAFAESKIEFNTSTGHTHNGTDAALALAPKHYIRGGKIARVDSSNITVGPIAIEIEGVLYTSAANSASIDVSSNANYILSGSEPADGPIFVVAYNNSGTLAFKLSVDAPDLSYSDDTTVEYPLRYQKDTLYYRYIGVIHNRTNLVPDSIGYIDRNVMIGSFTADGVTEVISTLWTPKYIRVVLLPDATPAAAEDIKENFINQYGFATAAPFPQDLNYSNQAAITDLIDEDVAGSITAITAQSAGTSGSFAVYQPTADTAMSYIAWTDEV